MSKQDTLAYPNSITLDIELLSSDEFPNSAFMRFDFDFMAVFGSQAKIPVIFKVGEFSYRSTIAVYAGEHLMVFNKQMRQDTGYKAGDTIRATLMRDSEIRQAEISEDVRKALQQEDVWEIFSKYSYSHQKESMDWINDTKKTETRAKRIARLIEKLKTKP